MPVSSAGADAIFPNQLARFCVQRLHGVARIGQIHDPVVHDRRRLIPGAFIHRPDPLASCSSFTLSVVICLSGL